MEWKYSNIFKLKEKDIKKFKVNKNLQKKMKKTKSYSSSEEEEEEDPNPFWNKSNIF